MLKNISISVCFVGIVSLFQSVPAADVETLLTMNWDPNVALSITSELVVMEVINRIFICVFEVRLMLQMALLMPTLLKMLHQSQRFH